MNAENAIFLHWVDQAAKLPVAFAQVREDALIDLSILDLIGRDDIHVMMIASGGCTAAALAASNHVAHLQLVDVNPAQMALCRLKLHLLENTSPVERAQVLGHQHLSAGTRAKRLVKFFETAGFPNDVLGPLSLVAGIGPDYLGRYEGVFFQLQEQISNFADQVETLLNSGDAAARASAIEPIGDIGRNLDEAFDRAMALPILVRLFGAQATQNSREPFSRHFANRTRQAIATLPTRDNPYLWQLLRGRFPVGCNNPWLDMPAPARMPMVSEFIGPMDAALAAGKGGFDFVHLSNILDWLTAAQAARTLTLAADQVRSGGYVLMRQLNSTLDIPSLSDRFEWLTDEARAMHARDRSFFYRQLHLGKKR